MRLAILVLVLLLVFVTLNYILKCLEYKDLQSVNEAYSRVYSKSKVDAEKLQKRFDIAIKINAQLDAENDNLLRTSQIQFGEIVRLKHRVYVLKKDTKRNQRAIVRYKAQSAKFKHTCAELEERNKKLRRMYTTEIQTEQLLRSMWYATMDERNAYLYCLRQIQEEVNDAKEK